MASKWTLIRNGNALIGKQDSLSPASVLIKDNVIERIGSDVGPKRIEFGIEFILRRHLVADLAEQPQRQIVRLISHGGSKSLLNVA